MHLDFERCFAHGRRALPLPVATELHLSSQRPFYMAVEHRGVHHHHDLPLRRSDKAEVDNCHPLSRSQARRTQTGVGHEARQSWGVRRCPWLDLLLVGAGEDKGWGPKKILGGGRLPWQWRRVVSAGGTPPPSYFQILCRLALPSRHIFLGSLWILASRFDFH